MNKIIFSPLLLIMFQFGGKAQNNIKVTKFDNTLAIIAGKSEYSDVSKTIIFTSETKKGLVELRYNYEWAGNYSIYISPTFNLDKSKNIVFQPLIGYTFGKYKGYSLDFQVNLDYSKFDILTDHQYTRELNGEHSFFLIGL
jgi:hypothetical protein